MENTLTAAKVNSARHKRQRLLNSQAFAEKAACLVKFVWAVHCRRSEDPDWEMADFAVSGPMDDQDVDEASELQITPELFTFLRTFDELKRLLHALDVTDEDQVDLFDTLDVDGGGMIDLEELIVGISKLRGDARRSDIVGVSLVVRCIQADLRVLKEDIAKLETGFRPRPSAEPLPTSLGTEGPLRPGFSSMVV